MWTKATFGRVHVASIALCAIMVPWSTAYLSIAQMLMVVNWLAWGISQRDLGSRSRQAFTALPSAVFLSILGVHVVGLLWTSSEGMPWGLDLTRILLPVLTFGVVLSSTPRLTSRELRTILLLGAWSVVVSTVVCILIADPGSDYRDMSVFISHIRLALLLAFAVVVLLYHAPGPWWRWVVHAIAIAWALHYINRLGSLQSMALLVLIAAVFVWRSALRRRPAVRVTVRSLLVIILLGAVGAIVNTIQQRYSLPPMELADSLEFTAGGEVYMHDLENPQQENGEHVWTWIAINELYRTWPHRSDRPLSGNDQRGHPLYGTLVRYMTSLGLRKDSVGVMAMSEDDVRNIERGVPSVQDGTRSQLHERIDEVLLEIEQYRAYGRVNGHSVTMRLEFKKVGWSIARAHWPTGVGTGDTQVAFNAAYERMDTRLDPRWWLRAHDQYLTWLISFGVFGLLWLLFAIVWPAWRLHAWRDPLFIAWAILFAGASLTDDTLETQAGATFFALYYALFVFAAPRSKEGGPDQEA